MAQLCNKLHTHRVVNFCSACNLNEVNLYFCEQNVNINIYGSRLHNRFDNIWIQCQMILSFNKYTLVQNFYNFYTFNDVMIM